MVLSLRIEMATGRHATISQITKSVNVEAMFACGQACDGTGNMDGICSWGEED